MKHPPDDIGQIRDVLTGHVAHEIIKEIHKKVKQSDRLYNEFGKFIEMGEAEKEVVSRYRWVKIILCLTYTVCITPPMPDCLAEKVN